MARPPPTEGSAEGDHFAALWREFKGETPELRPIFTVVEVRPVHIRIRDYAIVGGSAGALAGAIRRAVLDLPVLEGAAWISVHWAAAAGSFIGLRHLLVRGDWREDREVVSGMAASAVGAGSALLHRQPKMMGHMAIYGFFGGCAAHFSHRWWLRWRLAREGG